MGYKEYYKNYLGINEDNLNNQKNIVLSQQRTKPICFYYVHHVIITNINDRTVFSVSPEFQRIIEEFYKNKENIIFNDYLIEELKSVFNEQIEEINVRKMYRMTVSRENLEDKSIGYNVIQLTEKHKGIYLNTMPNSISDDIKEQKWRMRKEQIDEGRMFVIVEDGKNISYAIISDIDFNGANIAVWTASEHTSKGYGKAVVSEAVKWCFKRNIVPVYLVEKSNIASRKIADSIGFKVFSQEIIVSSVRRNSKENYK